MTGWTLFYNPMPLQADGWTLWLLLPLCLSVAIIYKAVRIQNLHRFPREVLALMGFMIAGLIALGTVLWAVQALLI